MNEALNNDVQYPDSFKSNANDSLWVSHCIITQLIISRHRSIQKFESLNHSHQICSKHWFTVINEWPSLWLSYWIIISWSLSHWGIHKKKNTLILSGINKWPSLSESMNHSQRNSSKQWFIEEWNKVMSESLNYLVILFILLCFSLEICLLAKQLPSNVVI